MRVQFLLPDLSCGSKCNELNHWPCQTLSSSHHACHMPASHWKGRKGEILNMSKGFGVHWSLYHFLWKSECWTHQFYCFFGILGPILLIPHCHPVIQFHICLEYMGCLGLNTSIASNGHFLFCIPTQRLQKYDTVHWRRPQRLWVNTDISIC